jgi:trigger factor
MKCATEKAGICRKIITVTAGDDEVAPEYGNVLKRYVAAARIDGFRKGKAPAAIVEKSFARDILEETKSRLVPQFYRAALKQEEIAAVAIVDVQDVQIARGRGLSFRVVVDVAPDFKLPKYRKIAIKRANVDVTDDQVNESFNRLRESSSRFVDVAGRGVKKGDFIRCDFRGECEGRPFAELGKEAAIFGEAKDFSLLVGGADLVPGFSDGVIGAEVGQEKAASIRFPDDFRVKPLGGKSAVFKFIVNSIREKTLPEIDQEFLKRFGVESESVLKDKIRDDLRRFSEERGKENEKSEIINALLDQTEIDVPQSIVEQERSMMIREIVNRIAMQGATKEQIEGRRNDILDTATRSSLERVKTSYILSRIAEEEKIGVNDDEVSGRVTALAARYEMQPERLRAELEKRNSMEGLKSDIKAEKTLEFLRVNAKIKE